MKKTVFALLIAFAVNAHAADLPGWMAGSWQLKTADVTMEEHWTSAGGTLMLGMHRDVSKNGKTSFEFLRIERKDDGSLVYLAMPGGRPATPFPLKTITASRVVFENTAHDFPQRILYWLDGKKLCARVEGTIGGKEEGEQWCFARFAM